MMHALLLLVSAASALAVPTSRHVQPRQSTVDPYDANIWCPNEDKLNDPEAFVSLWNEGLGIAEFFDNYLTTSISPGDRDWLRYLANDAFPNNGGTDARDCQKTDAGCFDTLDCQALVAQGKGAYYWILKATNGLHESAAASHTQLLQQSFNSLLNIPQIEDTFSKEFESSDSFNSIMSAALGIAGGLAAASPQTESVSTVLGLASAGFSLAAETEDDPEDASVNTSDLASFLQGIFETGVERIDDVLALALGYPEDGDFSTLPDQGDCNGHPCTSPIAAFFSDGKWLLSTRAVEDAYEEGFKWVNRKLVSIALTTAGYKIMACSPDYAVFCQAYYGAQTMSTSIGERTFVLVLENDATGYWESIAEQINTMQDEYGIDMIDFYKKAFDCYYAGTPALDVNNLPTDGSVPTCWYNVQVVKGNTDALPT